MLQQALGTADATQHPAVANAGHRRHSTGLSARPPLGTVTAGRPGTAYTGRAGSTQPADAMQYLANKGSKIQELEAELKLSQAETAHLSQQLEQAKSTTQTDAERLATIQGERDFLNSQRSRERLDTEKQLSQAEQKILSLRKDLRHTEDAKVWLRLLQSAQDSACLRLGRVATLMLMQTQAEEQAHLSMSEANSTKSQAANAAATHRRQLQQLQNDLQLAQHDAQQAEQQSTSHIRRQQNRIEAMNQQLELLQQQLRDVSEEAELHNQQRMQAEEKVAALQLQGDSASAAPSDDSILLQNLRDELAAQCADVAEARRLKYHVRYHLLSVTTRSIPAAAV